MATVETITLDRLPAALRRTAALIEDGGVRAMRRGARFGQGAVQRAIKATEPYQPVSSGDYKRQWFVDDEPDGADLYNPTPYAPIIEEGSRPHWAPLAPLLEWARHKMRGQGFVSHTRLRDRREIKARGQQLLDLREDAAQGLARGAQIAIARRGTEGRHVLERSLPETIAAIGRILDEELARAATRK